MEAKATYPDTGAADIARFVALLEGGADTPVERRL
jgi:hypothetical protein